MINNTFLETPIGIYEIRGDVKGVSFISLVSEKKHNEIPTFLKDACNQLYEYFQGLRKGFDFKLNLVGTEFQHKVWLELLNVNYGETATYKDIAIAVGNEKASRAIGNANNKNPLPIVIPCHRIIGSNNKLVGYAGGLHIKKFLLKLENNNKK